LSKPVAKHSHCEGTETESLSKSSVVRKEGEFKADLKRKERLQMRVERKGESTTGFSKEAEFTTDLRREGTCTARFLSLGKKLRQ